MIKNALKLLGCLLHAPRGPFYSPKAARSRWKQYGKAILALPDRHCSVSGVDCFPKLAQPTVEDLEPLAHRTLSGAEQTVRCPLQTVGPATRHARIARPTVGSPGSPVNFSHTPPTNSRERPVDQKPAWRTRHCPVHHRTVGCTQTKQQLAIHSQLFFLLSFL